MKQLSSQSQTSPADMFRHVLEAYEARGFDTTAIRQWCIPALDAETLIEATRSCRPKRILEVGTYVGVSTLLMALADPEATIVTIDPNLPLGAEMGSMQSNLGLLESDVRTHRVAQTVARELGVDERIQFVAGGFAIGDTFSSIRSDPDARVPVVGPSVCAEFGPFDLIFIDGLHYASAVEADLRLAAEALAPGGVILMHDCIGMWGTNVRAGILRFLADHSEFRLCHPTFAELYRSIGMVFRADEHPELENRFRSSEPNASGNHPTAVTTASSLVRRLDPKFVVELAAGNEAIGPALEMAGVAATSIKVPRQGRSLQVDIALAQAEKALQGTTGRDHLIVSFGLIDHLSDAQVREVLGWMRERDVLVAFGFTPPGEVGVAGQNSRSFRHMVRLIAEAGLSAAVPSRFDADPVQFSFTAHRGKQDTNSYCLHTVLVGSKKRLKEAASKSELPILTLNEAQAEAFEQENLLRLHYSQGFHWAFKELFAAQEIERAAQAQIVDLSSQIREHAGAAEDLRREVQGQLLRSQDLTRHIEVLDAALGERAEMERDLRQQLANHEARSENLVHEIRTQKIAIDKSILRQQELTRQTAEQVASSKGLTRQILSYRAGIEERDRVETELRKQFSEQVARSEDLTREILSYRAAESELRKQLSEQIARSEDLTREILSYRAAESELRNQLSEQIARSEDLTREILSCRAAESELRKQLSEQFTRSEDLTREILSCRAVIEERNRV